MGDLTNIALPQAVFSDALLIFTALTLAAGQVNAFQTLSKTPHILLRGRDERPVRSFEGKIEIGHLPQWPQACSPG